MAIHAAGLMIGKPSGGAGRAPVSDNGFSLTFSQKGFKSQKFERHDSAAGTRVPVSRHH
jgi:hypothetical protein